LFIVLQSDHGFFGSGSTHENAMNVRTTVIIAQDLHRPDQVIDTVLLADFAQIRNQVALAAMPRVGTGVWCQPREIGSRAYHVDILLPTVASGERDIFVALVRSQHDLSSAECHPLEKQQGLHQKAALAIEFHREHFRRQIMVIEHEHLAERAAQQPEWPKSFRRIAGLHDIEAAPE
jgi:hypothetical protein